MRKLVGVIVIFIFYLNCHQSNPYEIHNKPPHTPIVIYPPDKEKNVNNSINLQWSGGDPDANDIVVFDIYLGENNQLDKIDSNLTVNQYNQQSLKFSTTYYWQIVAKDKAGLQTEGPVWSFITRPENILPPNQPNNPFPANGATEISIRNQVLQWQGGSSNVSDSVYYDIYFDVFNPPIKVVASGLLETTYSLPLLNYNTQYFWRIHAKNIYQLKTEGPVWSFTTKVSSMQFYESFDNYLAGAVPPDSAWTSYDLGPGTLFITDVSAWGNQGKSCKFVDLSPDSSITLIKEFDSQTNGVLEFAWRIDRSDDYIGLRLYPDEINKSRRGPQVAIKGNSLMYYDKDYTWKYIVTVDSMTWYKTRLVFDCENEYYSIYVNDELKVNSAGWAGTDVSSIKYIYFHSFVEEKCSAGYIDEIRYFFGEVQKEL